MKCKHCGGNMTGDGVTQAFRCENIEDINDGLEPDADPLDCNVGVVTYPAFNDEEDQFDRDDRGSDPTPEAPF